jgi:hypothetical protein
VGKKALFAFAVVVGVVLSPAAAWANHCANVSRAAGNAVPWETQRGRWFYIEPEVGPIWVFLTPDNFRNGGADALLENTGACNASRLLGQTKGELSIDSLKGIWSEECVNDAAAGLGG